VRVLRTESLTCCSMSTPTDVVITDISHLLCKIF
jgi:hypothetical protein